MVPAPGNARLGGELCFGTVDSFLISRLTGGKVHATDATNASRTLLLDIHSGRFDDELLSIFDVPRAMLPAVKDCATLYGTTVPALFGGSIAIRGVAGDQQAATIGQACFEPGMMKSTYGTGCFALLNTGRQSVISRNRLLTTIAYQLAGERTYALEGSIFVAGAAVQWLRDEAWRSFPMPPPRRQAGRRRRSRPGGLSRAGLCRPWGSMVGRRGARHHHRAHPRHRHGRACPRRARGSVLPDARSPGGDAQRLAGRQRRRNGAPGRWRHGRLRLDDAVPLRHYRCARSTGRRSSKPPRSAPAISPGSMPGSIRARRNSPRAGSSSGASRRRWTRLRGAANSPAGGMRCRGLCRGGSEVRPDHGL